MAKACAVCNVKVGWFEGFSIANQERICPSCVKAVGCGGWFDSTEPLKTMSGYELKDMLKRKEQSAKLAHSFTPTKTIGGNYDYLIRFDDINRLMEIPKGNKSNGLKSKTPTYFDYSEIVGYELLENGETVVSSGLGGAIVGGVLFGGVGAVVGAVADKDAETTCTSLKIKITLKNAGASAIYITFIDFNYGFKKNSREYKNKFALAHECLSMFQLICETQKSATESASDSFSSADEILKFKDLLDKGIINQSEFDKKKKQLLEM